MNSRILCLAVVIISFAFASVARAEERYMRYRLIEPQCASRASLRIITHVQTAAISWSWTGAPLPGVISRKGFYVPAGQWSDWRRLPNPPVWGTIYLDLALTGNVAGAAKTEIQVATWPEEKAVVKSLKADSDTGLTVGFILPANILASPREIASVAEALDRRLTVARSVAVPEDRRPHRLSFTPWGISGDPTIADGQKREDEVVRLLGMNTYDAGLIVKENLPFDWFYMVYDAALKPQMAQRYGPDIMKKLAYLYMIDEPGWTTGFNPVWQKTGEEGFRRFLKENNVAPQLLGKAGQAQFMPRDKGVPANASLEQRRLWYWSCRYVYRTSADYLGDLKRQLHADTPETVATVNFPVHHITLGGGMCTGYGLDYFEIGRRDALDLFLQEDWIAPGLNTWADGLYQKGAYLVELLRAAGRYHGIAKFGYHVICCSGYSPFNEGAARNVSARVNMLLGRGVKNFLFFNYGPTSRGTCDFWADDASIMRGVADAVALCGGDAVEPFLYDGKAPFSEACILLSPTADIWQEVNGRGSDGREKLDLYCMLTQKNIPLDTLDTSDLDRFITGYKAAYFIDMNMERRSAAALAKWVEAGGVLCLWPGAASKDEYNEPLDVFRSEPGEWPSGKGRIVRFPDRPAELWWKKTLAMNLNKKYWWPCLFDPEERERVARPALELAHVARPVTTDGTAVVANALVSDHGVAVPLVNLQGMQDKGAQGIQDEGPISCSSLTVTLADGSGLVSVHSARRGKLDLVRNGQAVSVKLPLDCTDIVIFEKH